MPGRDDLIAAAKLIPIVNVAHQTRPHHTRAARGAIQPAAPQVPSSFATGICYSRARASIIKSSGGDEGTRSQAPLVPRKHQA